MSVVHKPASLRKLVLAVTLDRVIRKDTRTEKEWSLPAVTWSRDLVPGQKFLVGSRQWESRIIVSRQWQGPGPFDFAEKEFPQRQKVVKQAKYLFGGKEYSICRYTMGILRELHPFGSLNHLHGAFLPSFLWPIMLPCLVLSHIWYISGSSPASACMSQPRWIPSKRPMGS